MKLLGSTFCSLCLLLMFTLQSHAASLDTRMQIELPAQGRISIQQATALALPTLWQRVVPTAYVEQANALQASTSLVLRFKSLKHGAKIIFNANQVRNFLAKQDIPMIIQQPHWNLGIHVVGFPDLDAHVADDLLDYSQDIASELGFLLGPRGHNLQLTFSPTQDAYGTNMLHVHMQSHIHAEFLQHPDMIAEGYTSYQIQAWLEQILRDTRDAYSLGDISSQTTSSQTILTIEASHALSTQVMLEQALAEQPAVLSVIPMLLQHARRQYRLELRDGDDSWLVAWFAHYGLTASPQQEDNFTDWLVQ